MSITVARLGISLSTLAALKGQDLEVASHVIFHVTELVYALATDTTDQILNGSTGPYILGHHLVEALVYSFFKVCRGIIKVGSDGNGGRPSPLVLGSLGNCLEEPIVRDFVITVAAALITVIIGGLTL